MMTARPSQLLDCLDELVGQDDEDGQDGEHEDEVDEPHEERVDPAPVEAGDGADGDADERGHGRHRQGDLDVLLDAVP